MADITYTPPKVWTWDAENGGEWARTNRPIAGATHETKLPRGKHPFQLYSLGTPNGQKVTIMFEELLAAGVTDAEYDAWMISIKDGDQFGSGFVAVNPNSKIPALLDCSGPQPFRLFESGAILFHLAEKFGMFLPIETAARAECMSWLMWQMSTAPLIGGGFGHFYAYAPEKFEYPINRYAMETKRLMDVADRRLGDPAERDPGHGHRPVRRHAPSPVPRPGRRPDRPGHLDPRPMHDEPLHGRPGPVRRQRPVPP